MVKCGMTRVESLLPKHAPDEEVREVLRNWRKDLINELGGRKKAKKYLRHINMVGVALQIEDGKVMNCICLDDENKDRLLGMRGNGWFWCMRE